ncbi:MAG: type II toxin-antitoxin system death-on-curing family toxin [Gemmatimonadota bacterium]|nr:type II toxin-antitoxin system death-on-curing family toxin [Gemmatimonadota bacterium]MDE2984560.1 type II toxin-antitoxin system death-on-curing family toxin [Gemmatimonadota bacterium]
MTRPEPRWIPRLVIEAVQLDQIREHGGLIGIRDENVLGAALARARHRWTYEPETDLAHLAACYVFGLCTGHPFRDGNKRIALLAGVIFLGLNGSALVAPEDEVVEKMLGLAAGRLDEQAVGDWIRSRIEAAS